LRFARAATLAAAAADLLVLPVVEGVKAAAVHADIDKRLEGALGRAENLGFSGGFAATAAIDTLGRLSADRVMLLGLGDPAVIDRTRLNHALEMGFRQAASVLPGRLAIGWNAGLGVRVKAAELAAAAVESAILAVFTEATHKSGKAVPRRPVAAITLAGFPRVPSALLQRSQVIAEETLGARELVNQPALDLYPEAFAAIARKRGRAAGLRVDVLDDRDLKRLGYGAILAVGMSSSRRPRLVVLRHGGNKRGSAARPLLALVGKGVTFDTGGISIKPAADMGYMKGDMGGAAAVLGAITAIARLDVDVDVVGILCLAENMVSSTAMRPGDVVRSASGKTIEVTNTDAEGRMVMADGMHHALQLGATHVLDIATLTGGQRVALGPVAAHLQGSDRDFTDRLVRAAEAAGERVWEMPSFPEYRSIIDSPIADLMNSTARDGMAITSGLFMREFAGGKPWIHIDMAAPSWNRVGAIKEMPQGPSGFGVRMLTNLGELMAASANPDKFSRK
jgi:leucyl aminopeptidase